MAPPITLTDVLAFLRAQPWAVEATVDELGAPQAAVIGIAISDSLDIIFDTLKTSRKHSNLLDRPGIALVIGWDAGCTVQLTGIADQPTGAELAHAKDIYFGRFPDGRSRERSPGIAYWRVKPTQMRYSDFNTDPASILHWGQTEIVRWSSTR